MRPHLHHDYDTIARKAADLHHNMQITSLPVASRLRNSSGKHDQSLFEFDASRAWRKRHKLISASYDGKSRAPRLADAAQHHAPNITSVMTWGKPFVLVDDLVARNCEFDKDSMY